MEESESRIILALDVTEREKAINISSEMSDYISFIKINWPLILSAGVGIVSDISRIKPVICDLKLADIPNTHRLITGIIKRSGAYGVIAHSFVGSDSLQEISRTEPSLKVFSVVAMSHKGASEVMDQQVDKLIRISKDANVYGVVAPANNLEMLKYIRSKLPDKVIISPGAGAQGGDPVKAISAGADFVIIGRSLYESSHPGKEAEEIYERLCTIPKRRPLSN